MTVRFHLFPFRTQKLSSLVPKIVRWKRRVKIGSRRLEQKRFRRNSEAFFFCRKALSNLFLRVYTGMLVSKNIRASAAFRYHHRSLHNVFWQKSPYSLPLHLVHLRPPASQFQRRTQHCCHCIDNNTANLSPMHSQLFSTPADQQHSPAWKRQPFRSRRYQRTHLSDKPRLQSEDHRPPCIHPLQSGFTPLFLFIVIHPLPPGQSAFTQVLTPFARIVKNNSPFFRQDV